MNKWVYFGFFLLFLYLILFYLTCWRNYQLAKLLQENECLSDEERADILSKGRLNIAAMFFPLSALLILGAEAFEKYFTSSTSSTSTTTS